LFSDIVQLVAFVFFFLLWIFISIVEHKTLRNYEIMNL